MYPWRLGRIAGFERQPARAHGCATWGAGPLSRHPIRSTHGNPRPKKTYLALEQRPLMGSKLCKQRASKSAAQVRIQQGDGARPGPVRSQAVAHQGVWGYLRSSRRSSRCIHHRAEVARWLVTSTDAVRATAYPLVVTLTSKQHSRKLRAPSGIEDRFPLITVYRDNRPVSFRPTGTQARAPMWFGLTKWS